VIGQRVQRLSRGSLWTSTHFDGYDCLLCAGDRIVLRSAKLARAGGLQIPRWCGYRGRDCHRWSGGWRKLAWTKQALGARSDANIIWRRLSSNGVYQPGHHGIRLAPSILSRLAACAECSLHSNEIGRIQRVRTAETQAKIDSK